MKRSKRETILIVGGTGFIGSHLVKKAQKLNLNIIVLKKSKKEKLKKKKKTKIIKADIKNKFLYI